MDTDIKYVRPCCVKGCWKTIESDEAFDEVMCDSCTEKWINMKEQIAFRIFDFEWPEDEQRPSEEICHAIAEEILEDFF